jgi:hypothetical protein
MTKREETLRKKYPDTDTFRFNNVNPKSRIGSDCVIRAIALVTGESWEQTMRGLTELVNRCYCRRKGERYMGQLRRVCRYLVEQRKCIRKSSLGEKQRN